MWRRYLAKPSVTASLFSQAYAVRGENRQSQHIGSIHAQSHCQVLFVLPFFSRCFLIARSGWSGRPGKAARAARPHWYAEYLGRQRPG